MKKLLLAITLVSITGINAAAIAIAKKPAQPIMHIQPGNSFNFPGSNGYSTGTEYFRSYSYAVEVAPSINKKYIHLQSTSPKIIFMPGAPDSTTWNLTLDKNIPVGTMIKVYRNGNLYKIYKVSPLKKIYKSKIKSRA